MQIIRVYIDSMWRRQFLCTRSGRIVISKAKWIKRNYFSSLLAVLKWTKSCRIHIFNSLAFQTPNFLFKLKQLLWKEPGQGYLVFNSLIISRPFSSTVTDFNRTVVFGHPSPSRGFGYLTPVFSCILSFFSAVVSFYAGGASPGKAWSTSVSASRLFGSY